MLSLAIASGDEDVRRAGVVAAGVASLCTSGDGPGWLQPLLQPLETLMVSGVSKPALHSIACRAALSACRIMIGIGGSVWSKDAKLPGLILAGPWHAKLEECGEQAATVLVESVGLAVGGVAEAAPTWLSVGGDAFSICSSTVATALRSKWQSVRRAAVQALEIILSVSPELAQGSFDECLKACAGFARLR